MTKRQATMPKRRVWIDTDPAMTSGNGEVDDGFALLQALRSPELDVVGISAVFGNTGLTDTYAMAQEITSRAGRDGVPVFKGHGIEGKRSPNAATDALKAALDEGPLTIAALGPLTNVAAALRQPDIQLSNVQEIVFVGGRRKGLEFRATPDQAVPFRDLNFELDARAAEDLLKLCVPITLAGWEVSSRMWLTNEDLETLREDGDTATSWLADTAQVWLDNWVEAFKAPGFTPFDTLAIGWLLKPSLFESYHWPSKVIFTPERPLFHADPAIEGRPLTYLKSVDNDRFRQDLMTRLLGKA